MGLWYAAGLPESFKLHLTSAEICKTGTYDVLTVYDTPSMYVTNIGMPPEVPNPGEKLERYAMYLSTPSGWDEALIIGSIAHELGHAFGLVHEHQDPALWRPNDQGPWIFEFHCRNLADFEEKTRGKTEEEIWGPEGLCVNFKTAAQAGFSALNFLPYPGDIIGPRGFWPHIDDVDWDSIMLYSSITGGTLTKGPVLTTYDGKVWEANNVPSAGDVAGLVEMYNSPFANNWEPFWLDPRSPQFEMFQQYSSCGVMELAWNPGLKKDCEHPLVDYWVCVGIPGGSGMTLVYPTGSSNVSIPPYASWTPTQTRNITFEPVVPAPTQAGLVSSCQSFYKAAPNDTCDNILLKHGLLNEKLLHQWNPALKDDCSGLRPGYYYCIAAYDNLPLPPHVTTPPHPTPQGTAKNCTAWYQADKEDTCSLIVTMFGTFSREHLDIITVLVMQPPPQLALQSFLHLPIFPPPILINLE
ncbi:hypothetical protein ASPACDRAFT_45712 [Aspergillus aculeatus ATCC 16872]|uniref:LysM domain-containing protein n=1 Tax=Aspergillus aculeatus (strain ATCC 16872 / CBS 172.66 / WB 5094) TaxID=690307 RepID=A0A1L9WNA0_ASPA1|nr:uncharacterized protein ASPACDRAFT_45712 [Aspergillus aculeatus ATCC 16872]OJJ97621.1 hypothetical protein ASPACDRAFT_45712 [Aspergillus aculeatus ATCC 16872]